MSDPEAEARRIIKDADARRPLLEAKIVAALRARDEEIERLRARVQPMEKAIFDAEDEADDAGFPEGEYLATVIAVLHRERDEARAALARFGKHDNNCLVVIRWNERDAKCDCGLQSALGATGGTEER